MTEFVHLRVHSKFSVGDSTLNIKDISSLCKKYNMNACALTDNNLMSGQAEFSDVMPKNGIQPIIGAELSLNHHYSDNSALRKQSLSKIVLLAKNKAGYFNLCELSRLMYMRADNEHLGRFISLKELENHSNGIICLSGGTSGPIGMSLINEQVIQAEKLIEKFLTIFGNNFYLELQRHGLEEEIKLEPLFLNLAQKYNIPIVATNDVYFASVDTYEATDALSCVLSQTKVVNPSRQRKTSELFFKSKEEMIELFSDLPEAIENTVIIASRCNFFINVKEAPLLPNFCDSFDEECEILRKKTYEGLDKLIEKHDIKNKNDYYEQADFELKTIIQMGYPGYFLIVADYINWCRHNDILVGPGRGSGAGSIVTWSLGITNVDPLKYGLLFERFLNPDRISMPDIDTDFEPAGLERLLKYVQEKYGYDSVCRIITFGGLYAKGAVRDVGRVFGLPYSKADKLAKMIPNNIKTLEEAVNESTEIQNFIETDFEIKNVVDISKKLEGSLRNLGQHACGIVIGDRPTTHISPIYRDPINLLPSCQFDGHYLENVGLIKFDFLGLETLAVLKYTVQLIARTRGINIDLDKIPTNDKKTMELFQNGLTEGIFQFDAPHVKQILKKMKPTNFLHTVALSALNRPGPIAFIPQFIARMHGEEKIEYVHPKAEEILKETYGVIVYQEQVMLLTRVLAGFTRGEADNVRKAMGKKIMKMMIELEEKFIKGCEKEKTLSESEAKKLWDEFKEFAKYAFNKSHSVAYSIIANQCAYLKAHYPQEFIAASMSSNLSDVAQLQKFYEDAKMNFNIEIVPPSINTCEALFSVKNNKIFYGLSALKGVGLNVVNSIVEERNLNGKFINLTDFCFRCKNFINKRVLEAFVKAGVLDVFDKNRAKIYENIEYILSFISKTKDTQKELSLFDSTTQNDVLENRAAWNLKEAKPWSQQEKLENEQTIIGFYISAHPLDGFSKEIEKYKFITSNKYNELSNNSSLQSLVYIDSFSKKKTKTGKNMILINGSDSFGNIEAVYFGESISDIMEVLENNNITVINGKINNRNNTISIYIHKIQSFNDFINSAIKQVNIKIINKENLLKVNKLLNSLNDGETKVKLTIDLKDKKYNILIPKKLNIPNNFMSIINEYAEVSTI